MKKIMTGVVLAAMLAGNAGASILFTDDFSGAGSGTGWSDSWSAGTVGGGTITVANTTSYRTLTTNIDTSTMDFWYVANLSIGTPSSSWAGLSFYDGSNEDLFFGSDGGSTTWEFDTADMADKTSSVANFTGQPTLLVSHVTATTIDMWIDPSNISSEANLGAADKSVTGSGITSNAQWTRIRIGSGGPTVIVNDMTAATTFTEAIPEPATLGMVALFGGGILFIRRKLAM